MGGDTDSGVGYNNSDNNSDNNSNRPVSGGDFTRSVDATLPFGVAASEYRLPAGLRLGPVHLQVHDAERSVGYYREVIGLRVLSENAGTVVMGSHGPDRPLVVLHERSGVVPVPPRGRLGLLHFAILLPDRAALGRFLTHVVALNLPVGSSDHLVSEALYLTDPDGLGIEVYADRPRADWRVEQGQVGMSSLSLDMPAVISAADGVPWTGAPDGTRMGHVHLHVGDLDGAEQFYHRVLGFDKTVWSYPGALFMSSGGYHHHLGTNTWARQAEPARDNEARLLEWTIALPRNADVRLLAAQLSRHGITDHAPAATDGSLVVRDPWGTAMRIVCAD